MYARRQRRVQSASTNAQIQILYELVCLDIVQDELVTSMEMCGRWTSASYDCAFVLLRTCLLLLTNDVSAVPRRYPNAKPIEGISFINSNGIYVMPDYCAKLAERPRGCLQSNSTPVQIGNLAWGIMRP